MRSVFIVSIAAILGPAAARAEGQVHLGGVGTRDHHSDICITPEQRAAVDALIAQHQETHGAVDRGPSARGGGPAPYSIYPQAGIYFGDLFTTNFIDMTPGAGISDYECTDYTYDGHQGVDTDIVTWTQKNIGVPIYAALDGIVVARDDGHFDEQTTWDPGNLANYVILAHGGGHQTWYFHMKTNSVTVQVNDEVKAGQVLGMTASSGFSTGPHLHFESRFAGTFYEPFTGACNPGTSGWMDQPLFERGSYLREFNITTDDLAAWSGPPTDTTRTGHLESGVQTFRYWLVAQNLPANAEHRTRIIRPDTSIAVDSGIQNLANPFYRWAWFWFGVTVNFDQTGTWTIEFTIDDELHSAPLEIVDSIASATNRPPVDLAAVNLSPASPEFNEAIRCTALGNFVLRDPDYDQVSHRFVWEVNDVVVRDVTIAAMSDILASETATPGDEVRCTCTPTDGIDSGNSSSNTVMIAGSPPVSVRDWQTLE